jgi:hypothetical protein
MVNTTYKYYLQIFVFDRAKAASNITSPFGCAPGRNEVLKSGMVNMLYLICLSDIRKGARRFTSPEQQ